jgi:hypothetical protein
MYGAEPLVARYPNAMTVHPSTTRTPSERILPMFLIVAHHGRQASSCVPANTSSSIDSNVDRHGFLPSLRWAGCLRTFDLW